MVATDAVAAEASESFTVIDTFLGTEIHSHLVTQYPPNENILEKENSRSRKQNIELANKCLKGR